ncbi:MAG: hypothetical protein LDL51_00090, partial [Chloroflexi bacterium]|nr:hypothetical protein [Chloroflexota bacterium]
WSRQRRQTRMLPMALRNHANEMTTACPAGTQAATPQTLWECIHIQKDCQAMRRTFWMKYNSSHDKNHVSPD